MTSREAFKFGFLLRCADAGLLPDEIHERAKLLEKQALLGALGQGAEWALTYPVTTVGTALAGSALLGASAGYMGARATDEDGDPEDAKAQELVAAYKQYADQARRNAARYRYRQPAVRRPSLAG